MPSSRLPPVEPLLERLAEETRALLADDPAPPVVVGIRSGGLWLAEALMERLGLPGDPGEIDIGFHRDDFHQRGLPGAIQPTRIGAIEGRTVLLVDDVLHSGRTARAAINALFEYGRPAAVRFAVLVVRGGRQLPIQADARGTTLELSPGERVKLRKNGALVLRMEEAPGA